MMRLSLGLCHDVRELSIRVSLTKPCHICWVAPGPTRHVSIWQSAALTRIPVVKLVAVCSNVAQAKGVIVVVTTAAVGIVVQMGGVLLLLLLLLLAVMETRNLRTVVGSSWACSSIVAVRLLRMWRIGSRGSRAKRSVRIVAVICH